MKAILLSLACLLLASPAFLVAHEALDDENLSDYLIMVPPWRVSAERDATDPRDAMNKINDFARTKMMKFLDEFGEIRQWAIYRREAGTLLFTVPLTEKEANKFATEFVYAGGEKNPVRFFVGPRQPIYPEPIVEVPGDIKLITDATWARDIVIDSTINITENTEHIPVLYVVDTGVQLWAKTASPPWLAHPQFAPTMANGHLHLRQGRVAYGGGAYHWPPTPAELMSLTPPSPLAALWTEQTNDVDISPSTPLPSSLTYNSVLPSTCLDPYVDPIGHGTKITSTAVGAGQTSAVGLLSRVPNARFDIESIRIYNTSSAYNQDAIDGISMAMTAHLNRATDGSAPSVLLFASRTPSWDDLLEVQLWWAWYRGMICVVCAGNQTTTYTSGKYPPDSQWFPHTGTLPSSPSRFDSTGSGGGGWPNWPGAPEDNPYPTSPYLIMVAGTNAAKTSATTKMNSGWGTTSSRGPDIDVLAPATGVPCANIVSTFAAGSDGLIEATGTSLSTGFVAGAALAYLCTVTTPTVTNHW